MSLRLVIFSAYYWPEYAGTAPYVTAPAEYLAARGHEVHVAAGFPHYPDWAPLEPRRPAAKVVRNGVTIHRRWHMIPKRQTAAYRAAYEASMLLAGVAQLPGLPRPDAYIGVSPALSSALTTRFASSLLRRPYGLIVHDLFGRGALQTGLGGGRLSRSLDAVERAAAARASRLLVLTEGFREFFVDGGFPDERIDVAPPWTLRAVAPLDREAARASLGWAADQTICVHAGNMGRKQGLSNIVEAARLLQEANREIRIVFAGDGNDRDALSTLATTYRLRNVEFTGGLGDDAYDAALRAADVLILNQRPSVSDMSMPSKLSAYLAAGRQIVGAVAAGSAAALCLEASGAGPVVDPSQPQALADALVALTSDDPAAQTARGERGLAYSQSDLSATAILPRYEQFVQRVAAARN